MGKGLVVVGFLAIFGLSVYYFQSIQNQNLKEKLAKKAQNEPRLLFEAVQIFQYDKTDVRGYFAAGQAHFMEPNKIELYGRVQGYKIVPEGRQFFSSESGEVTLSQNGIANLMNGATVEKAQLENDVHVEANKMALETAFAEYNRKTDKVTSHMPVKATGPNYVLEGENGFDFEMKTQRMQLNGPTKGVLQKVEGTKL